MVPSAQGNAPAGPSVARPPRGPSPTESTLPSFTPNIAHNCGRKVANGTRVALQPWPAFFAQTQGERGKRGGN
jgi:hypothetical protein